MHFIKTVGKHILTVILEWQVKRLRRKNVMSIVAVAGSIGKTSTKIAFADVLSQFKKVAFQKGNYNDRLTVPLIFFGQDEPPIFAVWSWLKILAGNESQVRQPYPYDVVIVELGPDAPGQLLHFAYLKPDISIMTAIAPEHMEFFGSLDAVAKEEMAVYDYSQKFIANTDTIDGKYLLNKDVITYGTEPWNNYQLVSCQENGLQPQHLMIKHQTAMVEADVTILGKQGASIALAVFAGCCELGLEPAEVANKLSLIQPVPGRMQILAGIHGTTLIDDTYNASPMAVSAALDVLSKADVPQRIAILGSMNELGSSSQSAHNMIGTACDPQWLDELITVGSEATKYLAPAAQARGCKVTSFDNPYDAGEYVLTVVQPGGVVLAKGSQNLIYCEEAIKLLLANQADASKLVRQSRYWLDRKAKQFKRTA